MTTNFLKMIAQETIGEKQQDDKNHLGEDAGGQDKLE
jgi:hypothetical protein